MSAWVVGDVRPDGHLILQVSRFETNVIYRLIADADGPVSQAIAEANFGQACTLGGSVLTNGKFLYYAYTGTSYPLGTSNQVALVAGALAGDETDFAPRAYLDYSSQPLQTGYAVGVPGVLEVGAGQQFTLHDWQDPSQIQTIWSPSEDNGLYQNFPFFQGGALFWSSDSLAAQTFKLKIYTPAGGARDFISFGSGAPHGVSALGADGHDLVWLQGDGLNSNPTADGGGPYATVSVMTSPYTTDPSAVVPRRLRSESSGFFGSSSPFLVGCGYAARLTLEGSWGVLIVRLSDGQSWFLTNGDGTPWSWVDPVALTCDEFFGVVALENSTRTIARVRLESLGPGIPAD